MSCYVDVRAKRGVARPAETPTSLHRGELDPQYEEDPGRLAEAAPSDGHRITSPVLEPPDNLWKRYDPRSNEWVSFTVKVPNQPGMEAGLLRVVKNHRGSIQLDSVFPLSEAGQVLSYGVVFPNDHLVAGESAVEQWIANYDLPQSVYRGKPENPRAWVQFSVRMLDAVGKMWWVSEKFAKCQWNIAKATGHYLDGFYTRRIWAVQLGSVTPLGLCTKLNTKGIWASPA